MWPMTERIRKIPIGEPFHLEFPSEEFGPGDVLELSHDSPAKFFDVTIVRQDGTRTAISLELAQMLFRNGALG